MFRCLWAATSGWHNNWHNNWHYPALSFAIITAFFTLSLIPLLGYLTVYQLQLSKTASSFSSSDTCYPPGLFSLNEWNSYPRSCSNQNLDVTLTSSFPSYSTPNSSASPTDSASKRNPGFPSSPLLLVFNPTNIHWVPMCAGPSPGAHHHRTYTNHCHFSERRKQ